MVLSRHGSGSSRPPSSLPGIRHALVVEDDPGVRRQIIRLLGRLGVEVRYAANVRAALGLLVSPLDLAIIDVRLPDGAGHAVLRAALALHPVPVLVAMSGVATTLEAFDLGRLGAVAFVAKPFGLGELEAALRTACEARHERSASVRPLPAHAEAGLRELTRRYGLTPRQSELLRLSASGLPRHELPAALGISPSTCKALVRRVLERSGARRLSDLVPLVFSQPPA